MQRIEPRVGPEVLAGWVRDARRRTLDLVADLTDEQLLGPRLPIVNPYHWEIGHVAWFQEKWILRHAAGRAPIRADGDRLYDSTAVAHATRWDLPLPSRLETLDYMNAVLEAVLDWLATDPPSEKLYFALLTVFHEDMHDEAFTYTRQTLGYPAPSLTAAGPEPPPGEGVAPVPPRDVKIPGGAFRLGAEKDEPFVFDNEKWAHDVELRPFAIAPFPVTQSDYATFVEDDGYRRREFWDEEGWRWRSAVSAVHPVYWRLEPGAGWRRRSFDRWLDLEPDLPVIHVNHHEAEAYCRWAGRRLPAEAEWEAAALAEPDIAGGLSARKRRFPWGDAPAPLARLDGAGGGCAPVGELPGGDSAFGCRQMFGNVWEWTSSDFGPYPGFVADPYREYSEPWFGAQKVLRGGCWVTRSRLIRGTWRNFYTPDRRDVWAGFRTCAADR